MLQIPYEKVRESTRPKLGGKFPRVELPEGAVVLSVGGEFDIHFYIDMESLDWSEDRPKYVPRNEYVEQDNDVVLELVWNEEKKCNEFSQKSRLLLERLAEEQKGEEREEKASEEIVVTNQQLKLWGIDQQQFISDAAWNLGEVAVWDWPLESNDINLQYYPDKDDHWVAHIAEPGSLLEHADMTDPKMIMVPNKNCVLMIGSKDEQAFQRMFNLSVVNSQGFRPLTRRPLVINDNWTAWERLPDSENPLATDYASAFGDV